MHENDAGELSEVWLAAGCLVHWGGHIKVLLGRVSSELYLEVVLWDFNPAQLGGNK